MRVADIPPDLLDHPHLTYSIQQAAELLQCSDDTVRRMIARKENEQYVCELKTGTKRIKRAFFEVGNVTQFPQRISDADAERIAKAVLDLQAARLQGAA